MSLRACRDRRACPAPLRCRPGHGCRPRSGRPSRRRGRSRPAPRPRPGLAPATRAPIRVEAARGRPSSGRWRPGRPSRAGTVENAYWSWVSSPWHSRPMVLARTRYDLGAEPGRDLRGPGQQEVAGQDGHQVAPAGIGALHAPPGAGLVDDVVVVQRAHVDQLDRHGALTTGSPAAAPVAAAAATNKAGRSRLPPASTRWEATSDRRGSGDSTAWRNSDFDPGQAFVEPGKVEELPDVHYKTICQRRAQVRTGPRGVRPRPAAARADDTGYRYTGGRKSPKERVRMTCMRSCAITERGGTSLLTGVVPLEC